MPLGPGPRPASGDELAGAIRELLFEDAEQVEWLVSGAERTQVRAHMEGPNIRSLTVDLTGVMADFNLDAPPPPPEEEAQEAVEPPPAPAVVSNEAATLARATLRGSPVHIQGVPVMFEASAENVRFEWLELADGASAVRLPEPERRWFRGRSSSRVSLRLGAGVDDFLAAVAEMARMAIKEAEVPLRFQEERLSITTSRPGRMRIDGSVRLRWKIFRPRFRIRTTLRIGKRHVIRLSGTKFSSSNPFVHAGLWLFRRRMNKELHQSFDLAQELSPWTITGLAVRAGKRIELDVQLARTH